MGALGLESVHVGDVGQLDGRSVAVGPRGAALGGLATDAFLLGADSVARLVVPPVRAVRVDLAVGRDDLGLGVGVLGQRHGGQGGNDDQFEHFR